MNRLSEASELLDGDLDERLLDGNLRDLSRVNALLDGAGVSWRALQPFLRPGGRVRLLDVGTGAADIPRALMDAAAKTTSTLEVVATDVRPEIVAVASRTAAEEPAFEVRLAIPDRIDEPDKSFDIVHSSFLVHHLEPAEAVVLLREMGRVARLAVIVNDLDRGPLWLLGARVLTRLTTRNAYTRNDAPLSVQRAYRPNEVVQLAARVGLVEEARRWSWPRYRYALTFRPTDSASD